MKIFKNGMTFDRYKDISIENLELTKEEIKAGWFFCCDWDDMLITKDSPEAGGCACLQRLKEVKE